MGKFLRFVKVIRTNWKKSTVTAAAVSYGIVRAKDTYDTKQLMREYCTLASKYGDITHPATKPFKQVTVILNPAANKKKAKELFEKYCVPLLHLAGLAVNVIQTQYSGQAKDLVFESLDPKTDIIVIAGGDGTVSEIVTGLFRKVGNDAGVLQQLPLAILPLGKTNSVCNALHGDKEQVRALADATMAIVDGFLKPVDVIKVEPIEDGVTEKPIYSLAHLHWGSFRDAAAKQDKYWYFGALRQYAAYLFSSPQEGTWLCSYTEPCAGCSKCKEKPKSNSKWWNFFLPKSNKKEIDYTKIINDNCGNESTKEFSAVEFIIESTTVSKYDKDVEAPHLQLHVGPSSLGYTGFVAEGWKRIKGERSEPVEKIAVRDLLLKPDNPTEGDWFSIDSEEFEVRPVKVSVLPEIIKVFQPRVNGYV